MKIMVLPVGHVAEDVLQFIQRGLIEVFDKTEVNVSEIVLPVPQEAYDPSRRQYLSTYILNRLGRHPGVTKEHVLGVTEVDLYVHRLNFVFGEAQCPGRLAIIALSRLKPEFYGNPPNDQLFHGRILKEAIHEIGHTIGLQHCAKPFCVMFFSNSISDTDTKRAKFCDDCSVLLQEAH